MVLCTTISFRSLGGVLPSSNWVVKAWLASWLAPPYLWIYKSGHGCLNTLHCLVLCCVGLYTTITCHVTYPAAVHKPHCSQSVLYCTRPLHYHTRWEPGEPRNFTLRHFWTCISTAAHYNQPHFLQRIYCNSKNLIKDLFNEGRILVWSYVWELRNQQWFIIRKIVKTGWGVQSI